LIQVNIHHVQQTKHGEMLLAIFEAERKALSREWRFSKRQ